MLRRTLFRFLASPLIAPLVCAADQGYQRFRRGRPQWSLHIKAAIHGVVRATVEADGVVVSQPLLQGDGQEREYKIAMWTRRPYHEVAGWRILPKNFRVTFDGWVRLYRCATEIQRAPSDYSQLES